MHESNRFENLAEERLHQFYWKTLVLILFYDVVQRLAERLKHYTIELIMIKRLHIANYLVLVFAIELVQFSDDRLLSSC